MDLFPFLAPSRPGVPPVGIKPTAEGNASARGLTGALAAFLAVFAGRLPDQGGGDADTAIANDTSIGAIAGTTLLADGTEPETAEGDATADGMSAEPFATAAVPTVAVATAIAPVQMVEPGSSEAPDESDALMTPTARTVSETAAHGQQVGEVRWHLPTPPVPGPPQQGNGQTGGDVWKPGAVRPDDSGRTHMPGRDALVPNATTVREVRPSDTGGTSELRALPGSDSTLTVRLAAQDSDTGPVAANHRPSGSPPVPSRSAEPGLPLTMPPPATPVSSFATDAVVLSGPAETGRASPAILRMEVPGSTMPPAQTNAALAPAGQGLIPKEEQVTEPDTDGAQRATKPDCPAIAIAPATGPETAAERNDPVAPDAARTPVATGAQTISAEAPPTTTTIEPSPAPLDDTVPIPASSDAGPTPRAEHRTAPVMHSLPQGLGHRLAETVAQFPDRPIEVTLSPEELGRVRMSLTTHDGALTMNVTADRPETLDLLRRNIDELAQDFRDLGFDDLSFSFGDRPARQSPEHLPDDTASENDSETNPSFQPALSPRQATALAEGGLDLRL